MNSVRTTFIGTSKEGIPALKELIKCPTFNVRSVITQPDRPVGRKQKMQSTPIKKTAQEHDIEVYAPNSDKDEYKKVMDIEEPDLIVTISYGEIIPEYVINFPKYKCLNIHYSLLPELRGAVPVQMAILRGLKETGVTIQIMEKTLDTGPIIAQEKVRISPDDTTESLKNKLIPVGTDLLMDTLHKWINEEIVPVPQESKIEDYCYESDISKDKAFIKWGDTSPDKIDRMIRAFYPWPIAWTYLSNGERLKIFKGSIEDIKHSRKPGEVFKKINNIYIATNNPQKALLLEEVQKEGKKKMSGKDFALGWQES
jgi:methionyl-tRNA formyltransferase